LTKEKRFFFEKKKQKTFGPCGLWRELGATKRRMADFDNFQQIFAKIGRFSCAETQKPRKCVGLLGFR
jgi:hypothetical protein